MTDNHFRRLWDLGYRRLAPITPPGCEVSTKSSFHRRIQAGDDARGKAPGVRWPDGTWSGFDFVAHESTEADLDKWHAMGAGVGIKTGRGLIFVDCDTSQIEHARIVKDIAERIFGPLIPRIGRDPKFGFLLRTAADFQYCRVEFGERDAKGRLRDRVEVLSEGRQFVATGTHPGTGKPYRWPKGTPSAADVLYADPATILEFLSAVAAALPSASPIVQEGAATEVAQETLLGDMALIAKAVRATPNTSAAFPTREAYRDYGYAIKAAAGPDNEAEAFDLYADWCARWAEGENDPLVVEADWKRMKPPFRRGASWIYELAERHGAPGSFSQAEQWFQPIDETAPLFPEVGVNAFEAKVSKFKFLRFDEAADAALADTAPALVKGLLDQGAMTVLYGASNVGKTFAAMDIGYHVASGRPYAGMRVSGGAVLYVAAEGGKGAKRRVRALREKYGTAGDAQFYLLSSSVDLRRPDADLKPLIAAIKALGFDFVLIVIDTLSRALAGGDENSSVDMGNIVTHFDVLRAHTSAHLLVVHHSGKNAAQGARGHSLLRAATDTEIEVSEGVIEVTKQRDLDRSWSSGFELEPRVLGVDSDGDPITSCTVRLVGRDRVTVGPLTEKERNVLDAVSELEAFNDDPAVGIGAEEVVKFFSERADNLSLEAARAVLKRLVSKNCITKVGRGRWKAEKSAINVSGQEVVASVFQ